MVKSLDPNSPTMREALLPVVTANFAELVRIFPNIAFHHGSQRLANGTSDGVVIVYDLKTATRIQILEGHSKAVSAVAFSNDGKLIATFSLEENSVRLWQTSASFFNSLVGALSGNTNASVTTVGGVGHMKSFRQFSVGLPESAPLEMVLEQVRFEWISERSVQIFLASLALSSLVYKRHREHPRRPVLIWFFDTSKQALAAGMVHFANVGVSYLSGRNEKEKNPCIWYFLNILLDTTIGVGILYCFLKVLHGIADFFKLKDMKSGHYGTPPRASAWLKQLSLFITAWFFVKVTVVIALETFPFFSHFAELVLRPIERTGNPKLQVVVVMLLFPLVMNVVQAWLIDHVIKGKHLGDRQYIEDAEANDRERAVTGTASSMSDADVAALLANDDHSLNGSREPLTPVEPEMGGGRNRIQDFAQVGSSPSIAMTPPRRYSPVSSDHHKD
ncbi:hypothetical protein HDU97_006981 [Phlyctochytrium planicorne]|nr:hypothetical protein HDU97_006981 [Phlyctochytrium planicorne]